VLDDYRVIGQMANNPVFSRNPNPALCAISGMRAPANLFLVSYAVRRIEFGTVLPQ